MSEKYETPSIGERSPLSAAVSDTLPAMNTEAAFPVSVYSAPQETTDSQADEATTDAPQETEQADAASESASTDDEMTQWANRINTTRARGVSVVIEIGGQLQKAKTALGHGNFTTMVKTKVRFGLRQAEKYMRIAEHPVLSNANYSSSLPESVTLLNELAGVDPKDVLAAVQEIENAINQGKKVALNGRTMWTKLIPALKQETKKDDQSTAANTSSMSEPPSMASTDEHCQGTPETNTAVTDTPAAPAPMTDDSTADSPSDDAAPCQCDPEASGREDREEAKAEEDDSTPEMADADSPFAPIPEPEDKVTDLASRVTPSPEIERLSDEERKQRNALRKLWEASMESQWKTSSKAVKRTFLTALMNEVTTEETPAKAA